MDCRLHVGTNIVSNAHFQNYKKIEVWNGNLGLTGACKFPYCLILHVQIRCAIILCPSISLLCLLFSQKGHYTLCVHRVGMMICQTASKAPNTSGVYVHCTIFTSVSASFGSY